MTLPLIIAPNDPGHIDDHQEIHTLLGRLDGQSTFLAAGSATGALGSRPAASASNLGNFYFAASVPNLAFSDGAVWRETVLSSAANTFTAIQNFREDTFMGSGRPWVDVRGSEYNGGAAGDGITNDTVAITAAIAAAQALGNGTIVFFPAGDYLVTGITIDGGNPVTLQGAGGLSQDYSSGDSVRAASRILSTTNATIVHLTDTTKSSLENIGSGIRDLGIVGENGAGTSQHGVTIDQRGAWATNVSVGNVGGVGWAIFDCVGGTFINCWAQRGSLQGWLLDPTQGTGAASAVTNCSFYNCRATGNAASGIVLQGVVWGCNWFGGLSERNASANILLNAAGGGASNAPRFNRFYGFWVEAAGISLYSLNINTSSATDNFFDFARVDQTPTFVSGADRRNNYQYSNLSLLNNAQRIGIAAGVIRGWPQSSSDQDQVVIRSRDDSGEGNLRARSIALTRGITLAEGDVFPTNVPAYTDAICLPNNLGMTWRNAANSGNLQGLRVNSSDQLELGSTSMAVVIQGTLRLLNQTTAATATAGAGALPATPQEFLSVNIGGVVRKIPLYLS